MPVEQVFRAVAIDELAITVSAWRYICDGCGRRDVFADNPMPEGHSELDASRRGWSFVVAGDDDEAVSCPACCARSRDKLLQRIRDAEGGKRDE